MTPNRPIPQPLFSFSSFDRSIREAGSLEEKEEIMKSAQGFQISHVDARRAITGDK